MFNFTPFNISNFDYTKNELKIIIIIIIKDNGTKVKKQIT